MNEEGFTLIEVLIWIGVIGTVIGVSAQILRLQMGNVEELKISRFYDEVALIDDYFGKGGEAVYSGETIRVGEVSLENTEQGVALNIGGKSIQTMKYLKEMEIHEIEEIHVLDDEGTLHKVKPKKMLNIVFNPRAPDRGLWFKEVVTYVYE